MIFLVSGVLAENDFFCSTDKECQDMYQNCMSGCGSDGKCYRLQTLVADTRYPYCDCGNDVCDSEESITTCLKDCNQTCAKEGESTGPGIAPNKLCCSGLTDMYRGLNEYENICGYHGADMGSICTKCGDGICKTGENKCNCPVDCNKTCVTQDSACCERDICTTMDIMCVSGTIPYSGGCDSNCSPIMGCKNLTCIIELGKAYYPGTEKCCNGLKSILPGSFYDKNCNEINGLAGAPLCAPCGNGKCEVQYGEDKCNCAEDCKSDCIQNENNKSCCKNGTCVKLFDDGLPSACSDGNLPEFSGCDTNCKPVSECDNSECQTSKECRDRYQSCYYVCENNNCLWTTSPLQNGDKIISYPNCSGDEFNVTGPQDVLCAPDRKQCADGSYVGRAGFDCEFMPCLSGEKIGFFERIFSWFRNIFR